MEAARVHSDQGLESLAAGAMTLPRHRSSPPARATVWATR